MSESLSSLPSGMRYYFGAEARLRRRVEAAVMSVFEGWSYEEIDAPSLDYYALFEHGMGRREARRAFRFADADGGMLALRPDVTSAVARAAATLLANRQRPLRLCYSGLVFRQQQTSHARWGREAVQLGCEHVGSPHPAAADVEVLAAAAEVLERLGLGARYTVTLNDVGVFHGVAARLNLDAEAGERMRDLIDSRDVGELRRFLNGRASEDEARAFAQLVELPGKSELLAEARRLIKNERSVAALGRLERLWKAVAALNLSERFEVDLGDVSGLDYYTGLTFKIYVEGVGARAGGGGRYDTLISNFGRAEPAVGFVLELDALVDAIAAANPEALSEVATPGDVALAEALRGRDGNGGNADVVELLRRARERRANGARVRLDTEEGERV